CHESIFEKFKQTVHYRINKFETHGIPVGCESCHGPGSRHVESKGNPQLIIDFSHLSSARSSSACLRCHKRWPFYLWRENIHAVNNIGCLNCHASHGKKSRNMLFKKDPALCFECHPKNKVQSMFPSHHPIIEGKMNCSSCHNIHSSNNTCLQEDTVNQLCLKCHWEYEGPFVFEHDPVVESCTLCHDVHGSPNNNLLNQSEPFICLRCHRGHRDKDLPYDHPPGANFMEKCTHCHDQVHGSDMPSQMGGRGLTR
ncbi:MAG: DmsE family decaheme c-type cytochrome, partial [Thermodesulfobacteriota bacterium]|nr:DmsE family decaheme c-type cytochrome [Thermodesulfobacteriota bacterium]